MFLMAGRGPSEYPTRLFAPVGPAGSDIDWATFPTDLRKLEGILLGVEMAIADVQLTERGATHPGYFLFDSILACPPPPLLPPFSSMLLAVLFVPQSR